MEFSHSAGSVDFAANSQSVTRARFRGVGACSRTLDDVAIYARPRNGVAALCKNCHLRRRESLDIAEWHYVRICCTTLP